MDHRPECVEHLTQEVGLIYREVNLGIVKAVMMWGYVKKDFMYFHLRNEMTRILLRICFNWLVQPFELK